MTNPQDPFRHAREQDGVQHVEAEGESVPLILRFKDVRDVCRDWKTFSSDDPFMIVLHSEKDVRPVRQLPIETDPPEQKEYRALVEPLFRRPLKPEYREEMQALVDGMVRDAVKQCGSMGEGEGEVEAVREFALPLQSRALTRLLGVPESEAETWIAWGTHVFKDGDGEEKGSVLDDYIRRKFADAEGSDGDDFFSLLNRVDFRDRKLTDDEKFGFASLTFAGGRDTVIHTVSSIIVYLAEHPEALPFLREDEAHIAKATEEFVRYVSPLTAIARRCPEGGVAAGQDIPAGGRVGLCWPSANRDETVFENADEVVLDRAPNPHVGYGFGAHHCLGAHQARVIIGCLLRSLCEQVDHISLLEAVPEIEHESSYDRQVGYAKARVVFIGTEG